MSNREYKEILVDALFNRGVYTKRVDSSEIRTECPFCDDGSTKLYIRINPNDNFAPVYHCFRCESAGVVNEEVLKMLGITDDNLISNIDKVNKSSSKMDRKNFSGDNIKSSDIIFSYDLPEIKKKDEKIHYIENRLGYSFTKEDLIDIKCIPSLLDFLKINEINRVPFDRPTIEKLEDHYVGFLSYGNAYILFRDITNKEYFKWVKYPINKDSRNAILFYTISQSIDILTKDNIVINLSEGILDALSVCYNFNQNVTNTMNIAVTGKYYTNVLLTLLELGVIGKNVILNIYADNDAMYNKTAKNPTTIEYFRKLLYKYRHLYKEVNVYYNVIGKDFGVTRDEIRLKKVKL